MQCQTNATRNHRIELIKFDGMRKTKKQHKVNFSILSNCSITVLLRKRRNCLLVSFGPYFFQKSKRNERKTS